MKTKLDQEDLTKKELQTLRLLAQGQTYPQIQDALKISQACLHVHVHRIRAKTGIADTKDASECRQYLAQYNPRLAQPTPRQMEVLRLHMHGRTNPQIALSLDLSSQSVTNALSQGVRRLGIKTRGVRRVEDIKRAIGAIDRASVYSPMAESVFN